MKALDLFCGCGRPVQKPYKLVCSAECSAVRRKRIQSEISRRSYEANIEKVKKNARIRVKANPERKKESNRRWYEANSGRKKETNKLWKKANPNYAKDRCKTDIQFKLGVNLRNRLNMALKRNYKSGSAVRDLGCSIAELKIYIERQFDANMTWENWGSYWHLDHKTPLSFFDLTNREQFLQAVHFTNLQPLEKFENMSKGARITVDQAIEFALAA